MPVSEFNIILAMTERLGIKTIGELAEIKKRNNIKTNAELYNYLFMQIVKEV